MNYQQLLGAGRAHLEKYPGYGPPSNLLTLFPMGARWMYDRLAELDEKNSPPSDNNQPFDPKVNYTLYGYLKYGVCLAGSLAAIWWSSTHIPALLPLSVILFYILEIHFLFLFPLLIDHSKRPVIRGIQATFKIGMLKCLSIVIPISLFMLTGLFRKGDSVRNWYIGCLAILIWYNNEVRNRI